MKEYWESLTVGKRIKLIVTLILCLLVVIFCVQNWKAGELRIFNFEINIPITLLIFISMFIGYTIATLSHVKKSVLKDKEIKELKSKLKDFMTDQKDLL